VAKLAELAALLGHGSLEAVRIYALSEGAVLKPGSCNLSAKKSSLATGRSAGQTAGKGCVVAVTTTAVASPL